MSVKHDQMLTPHIQAYFLTVGGLGSRPRLCKRRGEKPVPYMTCIAHKAIEKKATRGPW